MKWKFKKYADDDIQRDSSSDKFFKESVESDNLIREFIQNSLDASDNSKPVRVLITEKTLSKKACDRFISGLQPHLNACDIHDENQKVRFIILEDFNTKGLKGNNKKDFFYKDNITSKTRGGGSHGIGKAVFYASSKIKTFFGYSIFDDNKTTFLGRAVLKSHSINSDQYHPDGILNINIEKNTDFIKKIFTRKKERGLSVAIPYCDIQMVDIEQSCLSQFYMPIINKKLTIEIGHKKINDVTLLEYMDDLKDINKTKVSLAMEYKTAPTTQIKKCIVKENSWKKQKFPQLNKEDLENRNQIFFLSCKIELPVVNGSSEYGSATLLIKKEEDMEDRMIDCWRDSLLITSALGYSRKEKEFSVILLIDNSPLSKLLRKLEDPGHTKWQTGGSFPEEVKKKYRNIKELVKFLKRLPLEMIRQLKYQPINQDSKFFSDYFPEASASGQQKDKTGKTGTGVGGKEGDIDSEPVFQNFKFSKHGGKGTGFTLKLKNKENYPDKVTVTAAYGTNIGNAFKNYDERDFVFNKDITIEANHGEQLFCETNSVQYVIKNNKFSLSFKGFDPDKELKIDIRDT